MCIIKFPMLKGGKVLGALNRFLLFKHVAKQKVGANLRQIL